MNHSLNYCYILHSSILKPSQIFSIFLFKLLHSSPFSGWGSCWPANESGECVCPWHSSLRPEPWHCHHHQVPSPSPSTQEGCRVLPRKSVLCCVWDNAYLEKSSYKHPFPFTLNKTHNNSHHRLKCKTNFWSSKIDEKQTITIQSKYFVHIKNKLCEELKYKIFPQKNPRTAGCATVCHTLPTSASSPSVYIMQDFDSYQICCL